MAKVQGWYEPSKEYHKLGGIQRIYRFEGSRYSASVICHRFSYGGDDGLWELAIMYDDKIVKTPITEHRHDSVVGWLTEDEVQVFLAQIDAL